MSETPTSASSGKGIIGRSYEQGAPVIWSFVDELPNLATRSKKPWLAVVSWAYDGSDNNGMPEDSLRATMIELENALLPLEESACSSSVYRRTGNGLKEFVYYIGDRDLFMSKFNDCLSGHPPYPLEINFYEDPHWADFEKLIADFRKDQQVAPSVT